MHCLDFDFSCPFIIFLAQLYTQIYLYFCVLYFCADRAGTALQ